MARTNKEEYEYLNSLDDKWKWIARDERGELYIHEGKPIKIAVEWVSERDYYLYLSNETFRFIQWEDEYPYNIQELIDEYESEYHIENAKIVKLDASKLVARDASDYKHFYKRLGESEETEVKKDLKESILGIEVTQFDGQRADLEELVNPKHLEKIISDWMPEVLSQEWIDKNVVHVRGLGDIVEAEAVENLLVPKQEDVDQAYKDGYEKGKEYATEKQTEETETVARVLVDYLIASAKLKLALSMEIEELEE